MKIQFMLLAAMILMVSAVQPAVASDDQGRSVVQEIRLPEPRGLR
jgi:hypothetical protein